MRPAYPVEEDSEVFNKDHQVIIVISSHDYTASEFTKSPLKRTDKQFFVDMSLQQAQAEVFYMTKHEVESEEYLFNLGFHQESYEYYVPKKYVTIESIENFDKTVFYEFSLFID